MLALRYVHGLFAIVIVMAEEKERDASLVLSHFTDDSNVGRI